MKPILPTHIIIDNLPRAETSYIPWIPIIVAVLSLFVSVTAIYYTRKTYIVNTRPYIWANNFASLNNNLMIPNPSVMGLVIKGYPAKVSYTFSIKLQETILFSFTQPDIVQFPDGSQWTYGVPQNEFIEIMNRPIQEQAQLKRVIDIDYSDLNGDKNYKSVLEQVFIPNENQWKTIRTEAK